MLLTVPAAFGHRQCDRLLIRNLAATGLGRAEIFHMMFLVWQDFATAREDRRRIPAADLERAKCDTVAILEEYIGWKGAPGGFIHAGIDTGFFMLTPVSEQEAELILADFYPANASATRVSNSEAGGFAKSYKRIRSLAEIAAGDQLRLFESTGGLDIEGVTERQKKSALQFIHGICLALNRQKPADETWKTSLIAKALEIIGRTTEEQRVAVIKWFMKNRGSQRIGLRLDLVLDQFESFLPEACAAFSTK
jgi:hypothetical protein